MCVKRILSCRYFHRETLTTSIQGRSCEVLTVTSVEGASAECEPQLSQSLYPQSRNRANVCGVTCFSSIM
jgi:hypothetical protein